MKSLRTLFGSKDGPRLKGKIIEKGIKKHLDIVFLSLLLKEPLCGDDIIKFIYEKFQILLSPSTVYPSLCELEKSKLVVHQKVGKRKVYRISQNKRKTVKTLIKQTININRRVTQLLSGAPRQPPY